MKSTKKEVSPSQTQLNEHIIKSYVRSLKPKPEFSEKPCLKPVGHDLRRSFWRNRKIVENLLRLGFRRGDVINYEDLEYVIAVVRGSDPRTVKRALNQLVRYDFLEPVSKKKVTDRKTVSIRTPTHITIREYATVKGYSAYRFGSRAPINFQSTLAPPVTPLPNVLMNSAKQNVCVEQGGGVKQNRDDSGRWVSYKNNK